VDRMRLHPPGPADRIHWPIRAWSLPTSVSCWQRMSLQQLPACCLRAQPCISGSDCCGCSDPPGWPWQAAVRRLPPGRTDPACLPPWVGPSKLRTLAGSWQLCPPCLPLPAGLQATMPATNCGPAHWGCQACGGPARRRPPACAAPSSAAATRRAASSAAAGSRAASC